MTQYLPIIVFLTVAILFGVAMLLAGRLFQRSRPDKGKCAPYECGFDAFEDARRPFDVRFYLVAILFIIFDLETAFLFPWAVVFKQLPLTGIVTMTIFLTLLVIGFIYEWRKGALEWE